MPDIRNYVRYPEEESSGSILNWAPTVVRGAGAILPGGFIGAGGNALLEGIAQTGENILGTRSGYNPTQIATQAGIGAIPFGKAASLAKTLGRGALLGSGSTLATQQAETGLHAPTSEELGGVAIGGLLGAGGAGIARGLQGRYGKTPTPAVTPKVNIAGATKQPDLPLESSLDWTLKNLPVEGQPSLFGPKVEVPPAKAKTSKTAKTTKAKTPEVKLGYDAATGKINLGGPVVDTPATKTTKPTKTAKAAKAEVHPVTGRPITKAQEIDIAKVQEELDKLNKPTKPAKAVKPAKVAAQVPTKVEAPRPKLPAELSKANPRYSIGTKAYELEFADDIDKAIYIVGGKGTSKSHQKYKDWLVKTIGMPEEDIGYASKYLRAQIKSTLKGKEPGKISLPRYNGLKIPAELKGEAHEMMPRKPRGTKTGERMFFHQHKPQIPPNQQIPIPPNKVTIPGEGSGSTAPLVRTPWEEFKELSNWGKAKHLVFNEARNLQTALDLSWPLRQGINAGTYKEFWQNLKPMMEAAENDIGYQRIKQGIETHEKYGMARNAGIDFTDVAKSIKGTKAAEEASKGILVNYLPPVAASNRAYTIMSNKMRMDLFNRFADNAIKAGIDLGDGNNANAKAIADIVNDMTGRGKLPFDLERIADKVNNVFFSPKLIASRINMFRRAFQDPRMIGEGVDPKLASQLRKEAIRSMLGVGGMALAGGGASALLFNEPAAGDPLSTDFGKLKIGKTRIDLTGGYQQYVRAASQLASGMANVEGKEWGDWDDRNRLQTGSRFFRNKLAPVAASLIDWMAGQNVIGEDFSAGKELKETMMPLIIQDLEEIYREDAEKLPVAGPAAFFGAGVQSYGEDETKKTKKKGKRIATPGMFRTPQVKLYQPGT